MRKLGRLVDHHLKQQSRTFYSLLRILAGTRIQSSSVGLSRNNECLIFGNGPSLKDVIDEVPRIRQGRDLFCVNYLALSELYSRLKPSHYVLVDPFLWIDDIPAPDHETREKLFARFAESTNWPMVLLVPREIKRGCNWARRAFFANNNILPYYFNRVPIDGYQWFRHFCYRHNIGMPPPHNVLIAAIFQAINIGYKKIYLFGSDHSWHEQIIVGPDNILYTKQEHFYDSKIVLVPIDKTEKGQFFKIHEAFHGWSSVFWCYHLLEHYSTSVGVKIYNSSSKSYIDAFERKPPSEIE